MIGHEFPWQISICLFIILFLLCVMRNVRGSCSIWKPFLFFFFKFLYFIYKENRPNLYHIMWQLSIDNIEFSRKSYSLFSICILCRYTYINVVCLLVMFPPVSLVQSNLVSLCCSWCFHLDRICVNGCSKCTENGSDTI